MDPTERRQLVASSLAGIPVPGTQTDQTFTVHPGPLDNPSVPGIVIGPRGPYIERLTFRQYRVNLVLTVLLPRAAADRAMDLFDAAFLAIWQQLPAGAEILAIGNILGVTQGIGGVEYMTATMDISL